MLKVLGLTQYSVLDQEDAWLDALTELDDLLSTITVRSYTVIRTSDGVTEPMGNDRVVKYWATLSLLVDTDDDLGDYGFHQARASKSK